MGAATAVLAEVFAAAVAWFAFARSPASDATCAPPPKCATRLTYLATRLPKLLDLLRLLYYLGLLY